MEILDELRLKLLFYLEEKHRIDSMIYDIKTIIAEREKGEHRC